VKRQREVEGAKDDSSKIANITGSSGTKDTEVMMARIRRCRMWLEAEDFLLVFLSKLLM
jgi:hypothetical protein